MFGTALKKWRKEKGLTAKNLAVKLNMDASHISRIETGQRQFTDTQLKALIKVFPKYEKEIKTLSLSAKLYALVENEDYGLDALIVAESEVRYGVSSSEKTDSILEKADKIKERLQQMRPLSSAQLNKLQEAWKLEYTYDSNRIEGNTLTLIETALVVEKGMTISGKSMREHLEAINHAEAIDFIIDIVKKKEPITERLIKEIHSLVLRGIDKENAGSYRTVNVKISGSKHFPPEHYKLPELMEQYISWYHRAKEKLHPILLAADVHERLVTIHPFIDGNGRTSRLLMNVVLLQHSFPIANISGEMKNRLKYYQSLEEVQTKSKTNSFHQFIANTVVKSLEEYTKMAE